MNYQQALSEWSDMQDHVSRLQETAHGNCMEIGVRGGVSTTALLEGIKERGGHLYSVDIVDCSQSASSPHWTFIHANSIGDAESVKARIPEELDVLFVDGDHSEEGCLGDLRNFGSRAKRIFVHDTDAENYPGVRVAVDKYVAETGRTVTYHSGSYGLGEIV